MGEEMRILVCGGRSYADAQRVFDSLNAVMQKRGLACVIHGGANGADKLAAVAAYLLGVEQIEFRADWAKHGKRAGPIRNQQMLDEGKPDGVIAFPGGRGTADMVQRAEAAGLKVWRIDWE